MGDDEGGAGPLAKLRPHRLSFGAREKLWRTIGPRDLGGEGAKKKVKPNALRLQISVERDAFTTLDNVINSRDSARNGVAEIEATEAVAAGPGPLRVTLVDDPQRDLQAHALIALTAHLDATTTDEDASRARQSLAEKMAIVRAPTKGGDQR